MAKKKKKEPKVEKVFENKTEETPVDENIQPTGQSSDVDEFLGTTEETPDDGLTESQKNKLEKLNYVKNKISKILQSSNIEIVDENFDDEYESASGSGGTYSQEDLDSLKAMFGDKDKGAKSEITLTIDDFDYSYIGQYLEEYDLMHMKNIKRVKIIRKKSPKLRKFMMISSLVLIAAIGSISAFVFTRPKPVYLKAVTLNQTERVYYLNDKFDYTGLYFIAEYSDGRVEKIKLDTSHFNGDMSTRIERAGENNEDIVFSYPNNANLVFTYQGFNVAYDVSVAKKAEIGILALYTKGIFNIEANGYITNDYLDFYINYEDVGVEIAEFSGNFQLFVDGIECVFEAKKGFKIVNGTHINSIIEIKYGVFSVELNNLTSYVQSFTE